MAKCLSCGDKVSKRSVLCQDDWKGLALVRKEAIKKVYGRGPDQMKFLDMLVNGDIKQVQRIVDDKQVCIDSFKSAKAKVDLAALPVGEVKVVYKVKIER